MTRIISSKYKASRRLGVSLWGTGKDAFNKRNYRPGQHGQNSMSKTSDYGLHLKAKQCLKMHYGNITEKQFSNTFRLAQKMKGNTGENFIGLLESRLDAVVYRSGIAPTIFAARQLVSHRHIKINGKRVNISSQRLYPEDVIELMDQSKQIPIIVESINNKAKSVPSYLTFDADAITCKFIRVPAITDVNYAFDLQIQLVVEYYSR